MMKSTGHILALCLTASGRVLVHDVWITGKRAGNNVTAEIGCSRNFPSEGMIPDRGDFFENPQLYNGKGAVALKPTLTDYAYKIKPVSKDNGYVLLVYMKPGYWSRISSRWKPVSWEGRNDMAYCEFAIKYVKSSIPGEQRMPTQLYQSPTGHEFETIPLSDISRLSENVKLKVLYKMSPLVGVIIELDSVSYLTSSRHIHAVEHKHPVHKAELIFATNEDGIVTVPFLCIGQWPAKVQNKKSFQDKGLCGETVDVAILNFSRS